MKRIKQHPLLSIVLLGLILRLVFYFVSDHLYYPDELYQSLEQSYRLVKGYGIIPWDFAYGIRSYVLPLLLAIPLKLAFLLHIENPAIYRLFPQILLILASLTPIVAGFHLVKYVTKRQNPALFAAFCLAIWYELIYFSSRALTEIMAVYSFSLAIILLTKHKKNILWSAFFLAAGCLFRPHFFPLAIISFFAFNRPKDYIKLAIGIAASTIVFGLTDLYFMGSFLGSLIKNIQLNFIAGVSERFGTQQWWYYLAYFGMTSAGISLLAILPPKPTRQRVLWLAFTSILLIHTLIPHKEYRFVFVCIPLWICLLSLRLTTPRSRYIAAAVFTLISLLGMFDRLPSQSKAYGQPMLLKDPDIGIYQQLSKDSTLCSIYDVSRGWVYTPSYFYLNHNVPIYSGDYPPPNLEMISHFIVEKTDKEFPGMTRLMDTNGYTVNTFGIPTRINGYSVFRNDRATCTNNPHYSRFRYFDAVQTVLQSVGAKPVIK